MIKQHLYLRDYRWECWVYYALAPQDANEVLLKIGSIGADRIDLDNAWDNLTKGERNSGLTYSNFSSGKSVIVIAKATTALEFTKSWFHEAGHLATHIATAYGINLKGEEVRYICDDIVGEMWDVAKGFVCECCRSLD